MDGLALLCNLHADGPLSLRRLRKLGVDTLADLGRQPESSLAEILKASPSQVRRFRHEGRLLSRRLEELPLESDYHEDAPIPGEVRARLLKQIVRPIVAYDLTPPDEQEEEPAPYQHEPDLLELAEVTEDAEEVPFESGLTETGPTETGPTLFDDVLDEVLERNTIPPESAPLKIGELPGLDSRTCQQLVAQGVRTYKALVDLANLNLARRTGIPFTRLLDLRHHARGLLETPLMPSAPDPVPAAEPAPRPVPEEAQVELTPQPRRVPVPSKARVETLLRDPLEVPRREASSAPPALETPVSPAVLPVTPGTPQGGASDEPGVAGPFV